MPTGTLYIVATPIGNLEDMSHRAVRVLAAVRVIAAEDTRHTRHLLAHYGITTPVVSYHEQNEERRAAELVRRLLAGEDVAVVSDAGMPAVSDPGFALVRAAVAAGVPVAPVPGPSAVTAALAASGLPTNRFVFLGFLPRKAGERRRALAEVAALPWTLVLFEAPHRIADTLRAIRDVLGNRRVALARELTKKFEEVRRGTVDEVAEHLGRRAPRGEITLVVEGAPRPGAVGGLVEAAAGARPEPEGIEWFSVSARLEALLDAGVTHRDAAQQVAREFKISRRAAYRMALDLLARRAGRR